MPDDVDRIDLRRMFGYWLSVIAAVVFLTLAVLFLPWYSTVVVSLWAAFGIGRMFVRQATSITFDATGIEVDLLFRKRHIRRPVAEFNGSRFRGVTVHDLQTDKTYDLALTRNARLVNAAESHGYAVLNRPAIAVR